MAGRGGWGRSTSPYHAGEQALHERFGRKEHQETMARQIHRPYMPDEHRIFFGQLSFILIGSVDGDGWPWASILFGRPGYITSPSDTRLSFASPPIPGDPLAANLRAGAPLGLLGIELPTRRRNRMNGIVAQQDGADFAVDVVQSYGNCPQYIQSRAHRFVRDPAVPFPAERHEFHELDEATTALIRTSDTFFVASHNDREDVHDTGGADVNHRGGRPGFVKVDGNVLTIPDYVGNFAFNTLGNFLVNPRAGLLFIDFETGDIVQLTGTVEVLLDKTAEVAAFEGAERAWRFTLVRGHRLKAASPLRFIYEGMSPNARRTGTWQEAERSLASKASGEHAMQDAVGNAAAAEAEMALVDYSETGLEAAWSPEDGTLLEHAEVQGLSPVFGCRNGQCGACATELLSGSVTYRTQPTAEPDDDYVLICCAVPAKGCEKVSLDL